MKRTVRFAENLKSLRCKNATTQSELAKYVCVSRQTVSNWEDGGGKPDVYMLARICEFFEVSADIVLFGDLSADINKDVLYQLFLKEMDEETDERYLKKICKRGFYEILLEDLQEVSLIKIGVPHLYAVAKSLKESGYLVSTLFTNGFGIYLESDARASGFYAAVFAVLEEFIHHEDTSATRYYESLFNPLYETELLVSLSARADIIGVMEEDFFWVDEEGRERGYALTKEECRRQAAEQGCVTCDIYPISKKTG